DVVPMNSQTRDWISQVFQGRSRNWVLEACRRRGTSGQQDYLRNNGMADTTETHERNLVSVNLYFIQKCKRIVSGWSCHRRRSDAMKSPKVGFIADSNCDNLESRR